VEKSVVNHFVAVAAIGSMLDILRVNFLGDIEREFGCLPMPRRRTAGAQVRRGGAEPDSTDAGSIVRR
jgi:hypothetical protein